ncbi:MAG: hypothetical protein Q9195_006210 [Heterodermia aff. obscurata]
MEAIPLLCKVCPKNPHFSDISHLLTHVDSKSHLKYYSNAKIRGRQDQSIRQQFDEYNQWYEENGIERLLSQRIIQKDSRNNHAKARALKETADKSVKPPRKSRKKRSVLPETPNEVDVKDAIDPRLSQLQQTQAIRQSTEADLISESPPPFDIASLHPQKAAGRPPWSSGHERQTLPDFTNWTEAVAESLESPRLGTTTYPDPLTLTGSFPFQRASAPSSTSNGQDLINTSPSQCSQHSQQPSETGSAHMMKLKGPQWPGMALFDSASPEAQRMRNQKKKNSTLDQMEYDSTLVQPIERIFFSEGTLKLERPITGNVESSPLMEPIPKPKRRRSKVNAAVLGDLSTNIPKRRGPRTVKRTVPDHVSHETDFAGSSEQRPAGMKSPWNDAKEPSDVLLTARRHQDPSEWLLNNGLPDFENRPSFSVYQDSNDMEHWRHAYPTQDQPATIDHPSLKFSLAQRTNSQHGLPDIGPKILQQGDSVQSKAVQNADMNSYDSSQGPWGHALRDSRIAEAGKENIQPLYNSDGKIDNQTSRLRGERIAQRYFVVSGNDPPRFYDNLPSEMGFGGWAGHRSRGSSLNPLNPQFVRPQPQLEATEPRFDSHSFDREPRLSCSREVQPPWSSV